MSKRPKYKASDFPEPGTVFIAPMKDGRLAAGRVARQQFEGGAEAALVFATPWIGDAVPPLDHPQLRETAVLSHHSYDHVANIFWVWDPLPSGFQVIGKVEIPKADLLVDCQTYTHWNSVPLEAHWQWRWDHDREALLQEEAAEAAAEAERRKVTAERRGEFMRTLTLETLAKRAWFENWDEDESGALVSQVREVVASLIADLRAAPKLTQSVVKSRLRLAIKSLNKIDSSTDGVMTVEREDICEALEQIVCAAKQPGLSYEIDKLREW